MFNKNNQSMCTHPVLAKRQPSVHVRGNISVEDLVWYTARALDFGQNDRRLGTLLCVSVRVYGFGISSREVQ